MDELPTFRYHPNPLETGAVVKSETVCICCELPRGFIYTGSAYSTLDLDNRVCPWCIADGTASKRFKANFCAGDTFVALPANIAAEVQCRTPGYSSWQQDRWQIHCDDACEFHGDIPKDELRGLDGEAKEWLKSELQLNHEEWLEFITYYRPPHDPAIYKFVCRHCRKVVYDWDCS